MSFVLDRLRYTSDCRRGVKAPIYVEVACLAAVILLLPLGVTFIGGDMLISGTKTAIKRKLNKYRSKAETRTERWMFKNAPRALSEHRLRSLSSLSIEKPQSQCGLLTRLPPEIRQEIYVLVVGGNLTHVVRKDQKLAHVRCKLECETDFFRRCRRAAAGTCHDGAPMLASTSNGNLALLRTCRQIYIEAVELMYSCNTFDFDHQDLFLFFSRSILPQRLAAIRSLNLNLEISYIEQPFLWAESAPKGWTLMWDVIARDMPGLKHLRVSLVGEHGRPYPTADGDWWLESILQVRRLKTLQLEFRAPSDYWTYLGDGVIVCRFC